MLGHSMFGRWNRLGRTDPSLGPFRSLELGFSVLSGSVWARLWAIPGIDLGRWVVTGHLGMMEWVFLTSPRLGTGPAAPHISDGREPGSKARICSSRSSIGIIGSLDFRSQALPMSVSWAPHWRASLWNSSVQSFSALSFAISLEKLYRGICWFFGLAGNSSSLGEVVGLG